MLEKTARIGYCFNKNIITDLNLYPKIEKDTLEFMHSEVKKEEIKIYIYAYMRCYRKTSYVDMYIFNKRKHSKCERFVITLGEVLPMDSEQLFLYYMRADIYMPPHVLDNLKKNVKDKWNIYVNDCDDSRIFLLNLYFTTHQAGVLEILFKMQLYNIALEIDEFEGINFIGTNVEDIFGVPTKLLIKCNTKENLEFIKNEKRRIMAGEIYKTFHNIINSQNLITEFQLRYLYECYENNMYFSRFLYKEIGKIKYDKEWKALLTYFENRNYVSEEYYDFLPVCPKVNQIERFTDICHVLEGYEIQDEIYKEKMLSRFRENRTKYEYYGDGWYVTGPKSVYDIVDESVMQKNCLYAYIPRLLYSNNPTILFMRKQCEPDKSWITMEIDENQKIVQALRCKNELINFSEYQAVKEYAQKKNLIYEL